LKAGKNSDNNS